MCSFSFCFIYQIFPDALLDRVDRTSKGLPTILQPDGGPENPAKLRKACFYQKLMRRFLGNVVLTEHQHPTRSSAATTGTKAAISAPPSQTVCADSLAHTSTSSLTPDVDFVVWSVEDARAAVAADLPKLEESHERKMSLLSVDAWVTASEKVFMWCPGGIIMLCTCVGNAELVETTGWSVSLGRGDLSTRTSYAGRDVNKLCCDVPTSCGGMSTSWGVGYVNELEEGN